MYSDYKEENSVKLLWNDRTLFFINQTHRHFHFMNNHRKWISLKISPNYSAKTFGLKIWVLLVVETDNLDPIKWWHILSSHLEKVNSKFSKDISHRNSDKKKYLHWVRNVSDKHRDNLINRRVCNSFHLYRSYCAVSAVFSMPVQSQRKKEEETN